MKPTLFTFIATVIVALTAGNANADLTVPFTENFNEGSANWFNAENTGPLDWEPAGGPDGSAYVTENFNFANSQPEDAPVLFRGSVLNDASDSAFFGNWLSSGVTEFSFDIRHNAPVPVNFFTRFAAPPNFPGAIAVEFTPIFAGEWTTITIAIDEDNPQFISFSGSTFDAIFSDIGRIQIGVFVSEQLAGLDADVTFDLDNVTIIPAPGALAILAMGGLATSRRSRRRGSA